MHHCISISPPLFVLIHQYMSVCVLTLLLSCQVLRALKNNTVKILIVAPNTEHSNIVDEMVLNVINAAKTKVRQLLVVCISIVLKP